ncbi:hypothetical protein AAF712_008023 [Marasmius tenuissimus]|uniref:Uncharacterized protein n=1 Tax=Marasmius tenuissimus TaxID=585030 RepID=A0ABR2ZUS0_9AGAR
MRIDVFDKVYAARGIHLDHQLWLNGIGNDAYAPPAPVKRVRRYVSRPPRMERSFGGMGRVGVGEDGDEDEESEGDDEKGEEEEKGNGAVVIKTGTGNADSMGCLVFAM